MATGFSNKLKPTKRGNACTICGDTSGDCRDGGEILFCHSFIDGGAAPSGWRWTKQSSNGIWGVFVPTQNSDDDRSWQDRIAERNRQREQEQAERQQKYAGGLPLQERDANARKLLKQCPLTAKDRAALLARGIPANQLQFFGTVYRGKVVTGIDPKFPGIRYFQRGGQFVHLPKNFNAGILCPAFSPDGSIIGFQIRASHTVNDGRYRWLWQAGFSSHLNNGELPLTYVGYAKSERVQFAEGILKPFIVGIRSGVATIGAAGANFVGSPEQLRQLVEGKKVGELIPDGESLANKMVMLQYSKLQKFLAERGIPLKVRWWGQFTKADLDGDQLLAAGRWAESRLIDWDAYIALASDEMRAYLSNPPAEREPQLTKDQWEEKHLVPRQLADLSRYIQENYDRAAWKFWRSKGHLPAAPKKNPKPQYSCTAIVLWRSPEEVLYSSPYIVRACSPYVHREFPGYLIYVPGELLAKEKWMELGSPDIIFAGGQRKELYREIYEKWDKATVLENSDTGQGKTHDVGDLTAEWLTNGQGRIFYTDKQHKNPTTANIEQNYDDQVSRNDGQKYDYSRTTPMGFPHIVRTKDGEEPDILGNCPETKTFLLLSQLKNVPVHGGKGSPICENCTHYKDGNQVVCRFILGRKDTLEHETRIRQHLDQSTVGKTAKVAGENGEEVKVPVDVFFLEEAASNLNPSKQVVAPKKEVVFAFQELKSINPALAHIVEPIFDVIYKLLNIEELPKHGWDFSQILQEMPDIKVVIGQRLFEHWLEEFDKCWDTWSNLANNVWGEEPSPSTEQEPLDFVESALDLYKHLGVADLVSEIKNLLYPRFDKLFNKGQTPEKKQQIVRDYVALDWISLALGALVENKSHLQVNSEGLKITKYSARYRARLDSYKLVVLQDSTTTKSELAAKTRIKKSEILQIRQQKPSYSNLTIKVVTGMGMCGKQRRGDSDFALQERLIKLVSHVRGLHPENPVGVIDHKAAIKSYLHLASVGENQQIHQLPPIHPGYWGFDNRASNAFMNSDALMLIGTPLPNLGDAAAEYHAQTGEVVSPTDWSGGFGRFLRNHVLAEVFQGGGRLRAHLKPHQHHTLYIVGCQFVTKEALAARYPGATIDFIDVYDFCPDAAPKGVQRERAAIVELYNALKNGIDATTAQVGEQVGVHRTTASRIVTGAMEKLGIQGGFNAAKRMCVSFIESFKTKRTPPKLDAEAQALADYFLPTIYEGLLTEQQTEAQAAAEVLSVLAACGAEQFKLALEASAPEVTGKLFGAWLTFLSPLLDIGDCPAPAT